MYVYMYRLSYERRGDIPDCKVCYARRRSSPRTFGCVGGKIIGYILSAQYFAKNSICRVEKHSKYKILKTIRY